MPKFNPAYITDGFADAVSIWTEYLLGQRGLQEWGVAAAYYFLSSERLGIPELPLNPKQLAGLKALQIQGEIVATQGFSKVPFEVQSAVLESGILGYLQTQMGMEIDDSVPLPAINDRPPEMDNMVDAVKGIYDSVHAPLAIASELPQPVYDQVQLMNDEEFKSIQNKVDGALPASEYGSIPKDWEPAPTEASIVARVGEAPANLFAAEQ